jgi:hypothetical protein
MKKKLTLSKETLRTLVTHELSGVAGGTSQWTLVVGPCVKPQPTFKCTRYPCFTDLLTQHCPTG